MNKYRPFLVPVLVVLAIYGLGFVARNYNKAQLLNNTSKAEYIDVATENCSKDNDETYCRCFYTELLETHSVKEVYELDKEAEELGDNVKFTAEEIQIAVDCAGN